MLDAPLILASGSSQRKTLLEAIGVSFETFACPLDEPRRKPAHVAPAAWAMSLAYFKAAAVAAEHPRRVVLGADTVVACDQAILGKPVDVADARRMLLMQIGRETDVITGVALVRQSAALRAGGSKLDAAAPDAGLTAGGRLLGRTRLICAAITRVWMRNDARYVEEYLASGDWTGKAGAYGIQNTGDRLVERLEGSFSNVVGLPVELISRVFPGFLAACRKDIRAAP